MTDVELDELYNKVDKLLKEGKFLDVEPLLVAGCQSGDVDEVLGLLTVTLAAKNKLETRSDLLRYGRQKWGNDLFIGLD